MTDPGLRLRIRRAGESDAGTLLRWRNDIETRRWSRTTDVVEPAEHLDWLRSVLACRDRLLLMAETADGSAVGTVRFDRVGARTWEVSITVAPEYRGRRMAGPLLAAGERELRRLRPGVTVLASVHEGNAVSAAVFRAAGYVADPAIGRFRLFVKAPGRASEQAREEQ